MPCSVLVSCFLFFFYRAAECSADIPDPPQCEQIVDSTWSEQVEGGHSDQYEPLCQNIPVETALEATEFTVSAIESENRKASIKRDKSNLEDSVTIEMSAQPLLELTPMTGSTVTTSHCSPLHNASQSGI